MIRVEQCQSEDSAKSYYTQGDYYASERQELPGWWGGKAAAMLGLIGMVHKRAFDRGCSNLHPVTGQKLTARMKAKRTPGYDIGFSAPKSVSLLYGLTGNADILAAFRLAYRQTMAAMEAEMKTRVRKGGRCEDRIVGNMAWAEYVHLTSRPVEGVIDPQLHVHCVVLNAVHDPVERQWKAGKFRDIKGQAPRFQAMFRQRFAQELARRGFPLEWSGNDFEIAGVSRKTIGKFSNRTTYIHHVAEERGITSDRAKSRLGGSTREHKQHAVTLPALRQQWRNRLTDTETAMLEQAIPARLPPLEVWEEERRAFVLRQQGRHEAARAIG